MYDGTERGILACYGEHLPPDSDALEEALAPLSSKYTFDGCGYWQHLILIDPFEIEKTRLRMKAYVGRYGRVDPFAWEDREVRDLKRYFEEISYLIGEENTPTSKMEDT